MTIPLGVDRKLVHHPISILPVSTGRSGQVESSLASQIKNPTITLIGESITPTSETAQISLSYTALVS